ncbi:MAG: HIT domain-containing protein [Gammaproteobacteria bacterium]|nr:HIT family protein [Gammaproteobacteria bacterium]NNL06443.1 HIT domain-containing protein [Gammaproteobacteria bacterium]
MDIHPQLLNDCLVVGRFSLSYLLLMQDANYPWFILVPDRENITEIFQLDEDDQQQLVAESSRLSMLVSEEFNADKINVAALGNVVPQLHIHVIARSKNDPAWPAPVWGRHPTRPYTDEETKGIISKLRHGLSHGFDFLL